MEEPQRSMILDAFQVFNAQFDQSVERARADLAAGLPLEDLIVGGIAEFAKSNVEALASALVCRLLEEAKKPVSKPRKKTAVIAKRARTTPEVLADVE